jgi:hypothetical protein
MSQSVCTEQGNYSHHHHFCNGCWGWHHQTALDPLPAAAAAAVRHSAAGAQADGQQHVRLPRLPRLALFCTGWTESNMHASITHLCCSQHSQRGPRACLDQLMSGTSKLTAALHYVVVLDSWCLRSLQQTPFLHCAAACGAGDRHGAGHTAGDRGPGRGGAGPRGAWPAAPEELSLLHSHRDGRHDPALLQFLTLVQGRAHSNTGSSANILSTSAYLQQFAGPVCRSSTATRTPSWSTRARATAPPARSSPTPSCAR